MSVWGHAPIPIDSSYESNFYRFDHPYAVYLLISALLLLHVQSELAHLAFPSLVVLEDTQGQANAVVRAIVYLAISV